jgi:GNAT superfamily N-acetyltransferase
MTPICEKKMNTINFSVMTNLQYREDVAAMMRRLYEEDRGDFELGHSRFPSGIEHLIANPLVGRIILFLEGSELRGYALLVPYWSNEFGGTLLFVDELFVVPEFRSRGIGRSFFTYVEREQPFGPVALGLGVNPGNSRARRLYESLGFVALGITTFLRPISKERLAGASDRDDRLTVA